MKVLFNPIYSYNNFSLKKNSAKIEQLPDKNIKSSLECMALYNQIHFKNNPTPIYAMDYYGRIKRFDIISQAGAFLNIAQEHIYNVLNGKNILAGGYAFTYAKDIEKEDGFDNEKLKALTSKFSKGNNTPVYAIDYSGKLTRFNNIQEAKEKLNLKRVYKDGSKNSKKECVIISANELDLRRDNGKVIFDIFSKPEIDYEKLEKILYDMSRRPNMPIYLVNKDKEAIRFINPKEAQEKMGIYVGNISRCLTGASNHTNGWAVIRAYDIELRDKKCQVITDKKGKPLLDEEKLEEISQKSLKRNSHQVSLLDVKTGEIFEFKSNTEAAKFLGISKQLFGRICKTHDFYKGYNIL